LGAAVCAWSAWSAAGRSSIDANNATVGLSLGMGPWTLVSVWEQRPVRPRHRLSLSTPPLLPHDVAISAAFNCCDHVDATTLPAVLHVFHALLPCLPRPTSYRCRRHRRLHNLSASHHMKPSTRTVLPSHSRGMTTCLLLMLVVLTSFVQSQSADTVSLWAYSDSACTTSFNSSVFDVLNIVEGACSLPAHNSGPQMAGFTQVEGLCSVSASANSTIISTSYFNTSAPAVGNSSADPDCPGDYIRGRMVINVRGVNYTKTSCLPAVLTTVIGPTSRQFTTTPVFASFSCGVVNTPSSAAAPNHATWT
jgi:hypothetical protein